VDVVAYGGAIGCVVVGAEDGERVTEGEGCIDRQREVLLGQDEIQ